MIISCTSCGTKYKYDEAKLEGVISKKVRCPKCKTVIEVFNPLTQSKPKSSLAAYPEVDPMEELQSGIWQAVSERLAIYRLQRDLTQ